MPADDEQMEQVANLGANCGLLMMAMFSDVFSKLGGALGGGLASIGRDADEAAAVRDEIGDDIRNQMSGMIAEMRADMAEQMAGQREAMLAYMREHLDEATAAELCELAASASGDLPPLTRQLDDAAFAGYILRMQGDQEDEDSPLARLFGRLQELGPPDGAGDGGD